MATDKLTLTRETVHVSSFDQLLTDLFTAMLAAQTTEDDTKRRRDARSSILHAALSIEHLANNCLKSAGLSSRLYDAIEQMTSLNKLEFFLWQRQNGRQFDRGCHEVQSVADLTSLRNAYVHPKVRRLAANHWPHLAISKSPEEWGPLEAETVFRALIAFLDVFLLKWCQLTRGEIAWLTRSVLTTKEGYSFLLFRTTDQEALLGMSKFLGQDLTFLGVDKAMLESGGSKDSLTIKISDDELSRIRELQNAAEQDDAPGAADNA